MIAGVEGGGTTWVCALASAEDPTTIVERASFPTTTPTETLTAIAEWLEKRDFTALGIASFGPIDPRLDSKTYGYITKTPKPGWENTDVVGALKGAARGRRIVFDTDVNAPALAEYLAGEEKKNIAYVTVGTGVGVGLVVNGAPVHGLLHPEAGHIATPKFDNFDTSGLTSLNCKEWHEVEANVASRALVRRAGLRDASELSELSDDHQVWNVVAHYLAALAANLVLVVSPEKIILSGGIMQREALFPKIRTNVTTYLNGYIPNFKADDVIVPSRWKNDAGIIGALFLAKSALPNEDEPPPESSNADEWKFLLGFLIFMSTAFYTCFLLITALNAFAYPPNGSPVFREL